MRLRGIEVNRADIDFSGSGLQETDVQTPVPCTKFYQLVLQCQFMRLNFFLCSYMNKFRHRFRIDCSSFCLIFI